MSRPHTEILVHIAAPSKASDDANYRTLAGAYLDFQPSKRTLVASAQHIKDPREDHAADCAGATDPPTSQAHAFPTASQPIASFDSPILSFRSVLDNSNSPSLRRAQHVQQLATQDSQSSWQAPPSVIQDSLPDNNLAISQLCSPTRIIEHFLHGTGADSTQGSLSLDLHHESQGPPGRFSQRSSVHREDSQPSGALHAGEKSQQGSLSNSEDCHQSLPSGPSRSSHRPETRSLAARSSGKKRKAPGIADTPSLRVQSGVSENRLIIHKQTSKKHETGTRATVIPLSPITNNATDRTHHPEPNITAHSGDDEPHIASSYPDPEASALPEETTVACSRSESEPPPTKRLRKLLDDTDPSKHLARSNSDVGPRQNQNKTQRVPKHILDKVELISPALPTGDKEITPADMITQALTELARQLNIKKRFKPEQQTRDLDPLERGYWLVDCTSWDDSLKESCWGFLNKYITSGTAGWGVWCTRDAAFSYIRLFCFGCVVGHMHLVLYLATQREIWYTRSSWVAGDGQTVIVMRPKDPSSKNIDMSRG